MKVQETVKRQYVSPLTAVYAIEYQGVLCESNTEPIDPGSGHGW